VGTMTADALTAFALSLAPGDFYRRVLDSLYDAVYLTDLERRIVYWNRAAEVLTGYLAKDVVGKCCADNILRHVNEAGAVLCTSECPLSCTMNDCVPRQSEVYFHHRDGHRIPVSVRVCPLLNESGAVVGAVEIFHDNSRHRAALERAKDLATLAFLDPVSQVASRRYLEEKLAEHLDQWEKFGSFFGILMVDVDKFKQVNDTYGHLTGDATLLVVARTLAGCLRGSDVLGRWGGDEFMAILPRVTEATLAATAQRCRTMVRESSVPLEGTRVAVSISVGAAAIAPGDTAESLVKRADERMYRDKQANRNR